MSRRWPPTVPRLVAPGIPAWRGAAVCGAMLMVLGGSTAGPRYVPGPHGPLTAGAPSSRPAPPARSPVTHAQAQARAQAAGAFRRIVLPDLVVIDPKGLDAGRLRRLAAVHGVRQALAVDGATITAGGRKLNVLGVDARSFRSWTPLHTASRERLWTALDHGGFIASRQVRRELRLARGSSYRLTGSAPVTLRFAGAAPLGISGIGLVVSNTASARLGLIRNVAVLVSAPGMAMRALRGDVRAVAGAGATIIGLRREQLPVEAATGRRPATYLELFKESAAKYCPGLSWTVLAAIGQIESGDGANVGPSAAGALGPMQFMPATWKEWGISAFGEPGPPNIMDPYDAVPSAARMLCASGAGTPAGLPGAIFAYNHARWYVAEVLALAHQYARAYG